MTARTEQQSAHPLAAILGGGPLHREPDHDAALLGLLRIGRHILIADEVNHSIDDTELHSMDQVVANDDRFRERNGLRHASPPEILVGGHATDAIVNARFLRAPKLNSRGRDLADWPSEAPRTAVFPLPHTKSNLPEVLPLTGLPAFLLSAR